jgi:RNA polymerase sigma-B factor
VHTVPRPSLTSEHDLLERYHRDGDFAAREAFIERTMTIVHHVARRYADRGESYDDLVQVGAIGLVKAVDRFDPDRGVKFATFAIPNIAGEIRRHFRDRGWSVRVPREVQERHARLNRVTEDLTTRLQRVPTVKELAAEIGLSTVDVLETMSAARSYTASSLDAPVDEDRTGHDLLADSEEGYDLVDRRLELVMGVGCLQERERRIVALRFFEGLTQTQIAERIGISQMHVSRLLSQALASMRERLEAAEHEADATIDDAALSLARGTTG